MKDMETQNRFIELRAQGWSFARIAQELNVHKNTLIPWSRKFQFQIQNLRAIESEALHEECFGAREIRWRALAHTLNRVDNEIQSRDLADVPTARLFTLAATLRREIQRDNSVSAQFTTPVAEIPSDELHEQAHDWQP